MRMSLAGRHFGFSVCLDDTPACQPRFCCWPLKTLELANHGGLGRRSPPQAATFATRLTQHVRQAAEAYWTCDERPWYFVIVIQVFVKTLNFCIIKTPESPVPAETYAKSRVFQGLRKQGSSDAIWGQTGHPN
jgi:hypothetical protein